MTMCAAITVPIIKDGYRLYPGMPVSGGSGGGRGNSTVSTTRNRTHSQTLYFNGRSSPNSPPGPATSASSSSAQPSRIIVGGATGVGVHHQVVLLKPRTNTTQITARSSFEVGPTSINQTSNRTAMSTSQIYVQKLRERCIQQQLEKQEMAKKQERAECAQYSHSNSIANIADQCQEKKRMEERKRKSSMADSIEPESSNPFRKFLRRLGFGHSSSNISRHQRHFPQRNVSECESAIEQAVPASESLAISAWH